MAISVICPCGQRLAANDNLAGKTVQCPKCQQRLVIPGDPPSPVDHPVARPPLQSTPEKPPPPFRQPSPPANDLDDLLLEEGIGVSGQTFVPPGQGKVCPHCHKQVPAAAVLCVECGWNFAYGKKLETNRGPKKRKSTNPYADNYYEADDGTYTGRRRSGDFDVEGSRNGPAWENELGPVVGYVQTLFDVLITPARAFRSMRLTSGMGPPITFLLMGFAVSYVLQVLIGLVLLGLFGARLGLLPPQIQPGAAAIFGIALIIGMLIGLLCALCVGAIILPISMLISTSCLHLGLFLVGGAKRSFEASFRANGYVMGAVLIPTMFLGLVPIPYFALVVGTVVQLYLTMIAVRQTHEISVIQSIVAVILQFVFSCALVAGCLMLLLSATDLTWQEFLDKVQQRQ